ncbi:MAG: TIGR03621 family F420-dependent LLM class oxidoreductase [Acidimicrobiales bacterium]
MAEPLRRFRFGAQVAGAASAGEWTATARRVEDEGYATLFMPDHLDDQWSPVPALAAAAAATTTLRIGSLVLDNDFRHPVVLAKEAATLDVVSGGRLDLGMGAGWQRRDYEQSGTGSADAAPRVERLGEAVAVVKGLFGGERFSFAGRHYMVSGLIGTPHPVQRPRPPILIGGGSPRVLALAGREADIVDVNFALRSGVVGPEIGPTGTAAATARKLGWVRAAAGSRFGDLELSVRVFVAHVTDERDEVAAGIACGFGLTPDEVLGTPHFLVGTVAQITDDLVRRREELGLSNVVFSGGALDDIAPVVACLAGT